MFRARASFIICNYTPSLYEPNSIRSRDTHWDGGPRGFSWSVPRVFNCYRNPRGQASPVGNQNTRFSPTIGIGSRFKQISTNVVVNG